MKSWRTLLIISLLLTIIISISGKTSFAGTSVDNLAPACVFLLENNTKKSKFGSGFLVSQNNNLYLITAAHVASFLSLNSPIIIAKADGSPAEFSLKDLTPGTGKLIWVLHDHADVAVLHITSKNEFVQNHLVGPFIPKKWIDTEQKAPGRQKTITILGFPFRLGTKRFFSPISRDTQTGSGLLELPRADKKIKSIFFITQDPSVGGFSGGPVFDRRLPYAESGRMTIVSGNPKLVGLVHGTISDNTGGKFGAIVPGYLVLETINRSKK